MRSFAHKQNQTEKPVPTSLIRSNKAAPGQLHTANPVMALQATVGNQAVQQLLQPTAGQSHPVHAPFHGESLAPNWIMRDELPARNITQWQTLVGKGFEEEKQGNLDGMEANFIAALKLVESAKVNIARGGYQDSTRLRPGLNLDVLYTEKPGSAGFLTKEGFTARLPIDGSYPESAVILGRNAFMRTSPINTMIVVEHEKTHVSHQRSSIGLLKEWKNKGDQKKFQKDYEKLKTAYEKTTRASSTDPSKVETGLQEIKARLVEQWFRSQKRKDKVEMELFFEEIGTMEAAHFDSEVLSALAGFMKGFHLVEAKGGVPAQDVFMELTDYPIGKGYWKLTTGIVKEHYKKTLTEYYCTRLDEDHKKAFVKQVKDYKARKWAIDATDYFKLLEGVSCQQR